MAGSSKDIHYLTLPSIAKNRIFKNQIEDLLEDNISWALALTSTKDDFGNTISNKVVCEFTEPESGWNTEYILDFANVDDFIADVTAQVASTTLKKYEDLIKIDLRSYENEVGKDIILQEKRIVRKDYDPVNDETHLYVDKGNQIDMKIFTCKGDKTSGEKLYYYKYN